MAVEDEAEGNITNSSWSTWNSLQRLRKGTDRIRNWRKKQDYPDYSIVDIG